MPIPILGTVCGAIAGDVGQGAAAGPMSARRPNSCARIGNGANKLLRRSNPGRSTRPSSPTIIEPPRPACSLGAMRSTEARTTTADLGPLRESSEIWLESIQRTYSHKNLVINMAMARWSGERGHKLGSHL